jgi:hypothetical protein
LRIKPLLLLLLAAGCRGDGTVPTVPVQGTVTLDGVPLAAGFVVFHPVTEGAPPVSATVTKGAFEVPAIPPGQYKAAVRSRAFEMPAGPVDSGSAAPSERAAPDPVPLRYREPSIPVEIGRANEPIKIELTKK